MIDRCAMSYPDALKALASEIARLLPEAGLVTDYPMAEHTTMRVGGCADLAVLPEARRGGVGSALLREGLRILRERGCDSVFLEVRESNTAARALYTAFGFLPCGVRRHYYRNPPENACLYKLSLKPEG